MEDDDSVSRAASTPGRIKKPKKASKKAAKALDEEQLPADAVEADESLAAATGRARSVSGRTTTHARAPASDAQKAKASKKKAAVPLAAAAAAAE
eukprot:5493306-Prymnesium_polylepis.1